MAGDVGPSPSLLSHMQAKHRGAIPPGYDPTEQARQACRHTWDARRAHYEHHVGGEVLEHLAHEHVGDELWAFGRRK